jgi:4-hydroxybenzoate polyprenyltransferase
MRLPCWKNGSRTCGRTPYIHWSLQSGTSLSFPTKIIKIRSLCAISRNTRSRSTPYISGRCNRMGSLSARPSNDTLECSARSSIITKRQRRWKSQLLGDAQPVLPRPLTGATPKSALQLYQLPKTGFLSYLPSSWVPYAELVRLDKPTGTYYLLFPCLFSTLLAADYSVAPPTTVLTTSILFSVGALIMRGAGCTINDLWDRNLDPHVDRTRLRPIARGAITPRRALVFTGFQLLAGLGVLLQFPSSCLYYGVPSLLLVASYPLAKRVTHYPQFVLGLTFSWGAFMGFPALGLDVLTNIDALRAVGALYASCVSWTVLYDMIYAHMDIKDDAKVGIKSIALRHAEQTKFILSGLAVVQIGLLSAAGLAVGAGPLFFVGSCGSAAATLSLTIWKVNLKDVKNCWWWFKYGAWLTGGGITLGLLGDYVYTLQCSPPKTPDVAHSEKDAST